MEIEIFRQVPGCFAIGERKGRLIANRPATRIGKRFSLNRVRRKT
jgi:hypothetical protein